MVVLAAHEKMDFQVAVLGAGPHGLAAAAYLRDSGIEIATFGEPMEFWRNNMPAGMFLRSALRASNIASPGRTLTRERWGREEVREVSFPLPLEDFLDYADWYRAQAVPEIDRRKINR